MMDSQDLMFYAEEAVIEKSVESFNTPNDVLEWALKNHLEQHPVVIKKMAEMHGKSNVALLSCTLSSDDDSWLAHTETLLEDPISKVLGAKLTHGSETRPKPTDTPNSPPSYVHNESFDNVSFSFERLLKDNQASSTFKGQSPSEGQENPALSPGKLDCPKSNSLGSLASLDLGIEPIDFGHLLDDSQSSSNLQNVLNLEKAALSPCVPTGENQNKPPAPKRMRLEVQSRNTPHIQSAPPSVTSGKRLQPESVVTKSSLSHPKKRKMNPLSLRLRIPPVVETPNPMPSSVINSVSDAGADTVTHTTSHPTVLTNVGGACPHPASGSVETVGDFSKKGKTKPINSKTKKAPVFKKTAPTSSSASNGGCEPTPSTSTTPPIDVSQERPEQAMCRLKSIREIKIWAQIHDMMDNDLVLARLAELGDTDAFVDLELRKMRDFGTLDRWAFENRVSDHPAVILKLNTLAGQLERAEAQRNWAELRRLFRDGSENREGNQPVEAPSRTPES